MPKSFQQCGRYLMRNQQPPHFVHVSMHAWGRTLCGAILIALLLFPGLPPMQEIAVAEMSADPDEEIVYIDNNGTIRVLDTLQTGSNPVVDWTSPTGGWSNFALGDVNNDNDMEIIGIKSTGGTGTLTVWDPVVTSGPFDAKTPNGIPWATLYETTIPGIPKLVATGKLDPGLPGDHIFYTYNLGDGTRAVVLKPAIPNPDGRQWAVHYTRDFGERWEQVSIGNIDREGADEIALVDDSRGRISVYPSGANTDTILKKTGESRPWRAVTIAEYDTGSTTEVIGIRDGGSLDSFFVFKYNLGDGEFDERDTEVFSPSPRFVFGADINNDGKEAIVMLRSVSEGNAVRMIVRGDDGGEIPNELEQFLDEDNGYRVGAGGDVDGDNKDEIVIMRDNNIRVYTQPDRNATRDNYSLQTNSATIHIGDLDRNGFTIGEQFSTNIASIEEELQIGTVSTTKTFEVRNETTVTPISYEIGVENNPSWITINPRFGNTPALISYNLSAINLTPGEYSTRIIFTSNNVNVINQPYVIPVKLTVTPAIIETTPNSLNFAYLESSEPMTLTRTLSVFGASGVRFSAAVAPMPSIRAAAATLEGEITNGYVDEETGIITLKDAAGNEALLLNASDNGVPWLSVSPNEGSVSALLTLTVLSSQQVNDYEEAYLVIIGDSRTGVPPQNVRLVPVSSLRATDQLYMPLIAR